MRYLPLTPDDRAEMLGVIGAPSIDALFADVPGRRAASRPRSTCRCTPGELEVERELGALAGQATGRPARGRSSAAPAPIATMCRPASTTSSSARSS